MNTDTLHALGLKSLTNLQSGVLPTSSSKSHLHGDWDVGSSYARTNHTYDLVWIAQQGRSRVVAAYLGSRAAKVEIDNVGSVLKQIDCGDHLVDISAKNLRDERVLSWIGLYLEP